MSYSTASGLGVTNQFGPRETGAVIGAQMGVDGATKQVEFVLSGEGLNAAKNDYEFFPDVYLPAGVKVVKVYAITKSVFALTGTTPTILVGTEGSEATNGFVISEAQAEATGVYDITSTVAGTFANALAAKTKLGVAFGGTTPVATTAGQIRVVFEYVQVA